MELKPGVRLQSTTCDTQVVVVKAPAADIDVRCGGRPMAPIDAAVDRSEPIAEHTGGTAIGKRYADEETGVELLCTRAGAGSLTIGEAPLELKQAKALPSSD